MPKQPRLKNQSPSSAIEKPDDKKEFVGLPTDVALIRKEISSFFASLDDNGRRIGNSKWGIYAFYDYDGEPIYIGQTFEGLGGRIGRHLTNQRTDAVAMNVLDPFEVAEIRVWPLDLSHLNESEQREYLDRAEFTLFQTVVRNRNWVLSLMKNLRDQCRWWNCRNITPNELFPIKFILNESILTLVSHAVPIPSQVLRE